MKEKSIDTLLLFDFYGAMLSDKQKDFMDLYYNEDLSLSEIAENVGISRQGVRDAIARGETTLREMESKLHLVEKYGNISEDMEQILQAVRSIAIENATKIFSNVLAKNTETIQNIAERIYSETDDGEKQGD